jgi:hypothetical protein
MKTGNSVAKVIGVASLLVLLLSLSAGITVSSGAEGEVTKNSITNAVFAEYGTATWCGYCRYAHGALKEIYASQSTPFLYVSLVDDKNTRAEARVNYYNLSGFPTVFFDGGYRVNVGAYTSVPPQVAWYQQAIASCASRAKSDVDASVSLEWLGSATVRIAVSVQNNELSTYDGRIRVYVTELSSSMGWRDTGNNPYTMAFLDYAFNESVSIASDSAWTDTTVWDGSLHNDGHGHNFGGLTQDNVMVIAAVFNAQWYQGYADPPGGNPFDAYFVDDAAAAWFNHPPLTPNSSSPQNGIAGVDTGATLSWASGDTDPGDTVTYDIYFGTETPPPQVAAVEPLTSYDPGTMEHDTTYYWQVMARDNHGDSTSGPIWSFTTNVLPYEPNSPDPGDSSIGITVNSLLSWTGGDPDAGDAVTYDVYLEAGDSLPDEQVSSNQSATSYNPTTMDHGAIYYWRIVSRDDHGDSTAGPIWQFTTNNLPYEPGDPYPANSAADIEIDTDLGWTAGDPDPLDTLTYDVYFGLEMPLSHVASSESLSSYDPGTMEYDTTYYWKVVVWDNHGDSTAGPTWAFKTEVFPFVCGDCNGDGIVTVADANYLVSYIYRDGPAPIGSGDVNTDANITIADANYLVTYIYRGGPSPCQPIVGSTRAVDEKISGR